MNKAARRNRVSAIEPTRDGSNAVGAAMAAAIARWGAEELENALAERKLIGVVARPREEWLAHPQGRWLAARPVVEIEKIADGPPEPFLPGARPEKEIAEEIGERLGKDRFQ
jgi:hypothetical protein